MSAGKLTNAGRDLFALKQGLGQDLVIDRFLLANIVGLDPNDPVDLDEALPIIGDRVAELAVTQQGYVSADQVVYSLYLDTEEGDYTFNWVGLLADDDTLVAVRYVDPLVKFATVGQDLGNALTNNFLVAYTDAQTITNITVAASSWQFNFGQATTEAKGLVELADTAEMEAGADQERVPPVKVVADYIKNRPWGVDVFPEIQTADNRLAITDNADGTVTVDAAQTFFIRLLTKISTDDYNAAARTLSHSASKTYHLRWDATNGFRLLDLADAGYNPTVLPETDTSFDSTYDDMLVARVVTDGANSPTITGLSNARDLSDIITLESMSWTDNAGNSDLLHFNSVNTNQGRTPMVGLTLLRQQYDQTGAGKDDDWEFWLKERSRYVVDYDVRADSVQWGGVGTGEIQYILSR